MRGNIKEYDPELAEWSEPAEREVKSWMESSGFVVTHLPESKTGRDLHAENEREAFYIEVERTGKRKDGTARWPGGKYPFPTYTMPERRFKENKQALVIAVADNFDDALITFQRSWTRERLKQKDTRMAVENEHFFFIPLEEVLFVKLGTPIQDSIAVLNARRVRDAIKRASGMKCKRTVLGDKEQYGMSRDEFQRLRKEIDDMFVPKSLKGVCPKCGSQQIRSEQHGVVTRFDCDDCQWWWPHW